MDTNNYHRGVGDFSEGNINSNRPNRPTGKEYLSQGCAGDYSMNYVNRIDCVRAGYINIPIEEINSSNDSSWDTNSTGKAISRESKCFHWVALI